MIVRIANEEVPTREGSLEISDRIGERSTCYFVVSDEDGEMRFEKGQKVEVEYEGSLIFGGVIERAREQRVSPQGTLFHTIEAPDWHYLTDKRIVAEAFKGETPGNVVQALLNNYLTDEGMSTDNSVDEGDELKEVVFNYIPASRALSSLAEKTNMWWRVDADRTLHFVNREHYSGPHLTGEDMLEGSVLVESSNIKYRNQQWVRGGRDKTDEQVEIKRGDGDSRDFPLGFRVAEEPTIEVSYNGGGWEVQSVGRKGFDDADWYWAKFDETITQDRSKAPFTSNDRVRVTYHGVVDVVIRSQDPHEVEGRQSLEGVGTGLVETVEDDPELESRDAAFELAAAKLKKYAQIGRKLNFTTRRTDLTPGQLVTVTLPTHNLDNTEMLVESITIRDLQKDIRTDVKVVEGASEGSWAKFFEDIATRGESFIVRENIGEDEILVILQQYSKDWQENEHPNIMREVFPSENLYPSNDLYPMFDYDDRITHIEWKVDGVVVGRKPMTTRENMDTDSISTMVYFSPYEAVGNVGELHWYGGFKASDAKGSGVKVVVESVNEEKTELEAWQVERIDNKGWS